MKRTSLIAAALVGLGIAAGGGTAALASGGAPVPVVSNDQAHGTSAFECYNGGKFSYAEFRLPLPHTCWFPGDVLVQAPASTITFKLTVPASITGGSDLTLIEKCTSTFDGTGDAQNPSYTCTIAAAS